MKLRSTQANCETTAPESDEMPIKKRQRLEVTKSNISDVKNTVSKPRGLRGLLKQTTEMPFDILLEIFRHLSPLDILRLCRTTKDLRYMLLKRSSISVWIQSFENVGLPPCPPDLTEPQYASLAYDNHCSYCFASTGAATILWSVRVRACRKCSDKKFFDYDKIKTRKGTTKLPVSAYRFLPFVEEARSRGKTRYYSINHAETWNKEYVRLTDDKSKKVWLRKKQDEYIQRRAHSSLCQSWMKEKATRRVAELQDLRDSRWNAIGTKLSDLGWEYDMLVSIRNHKLVDQPKELTARAWSNMKPTLIEYLEERKSTRLREERIAMLSARQPLLSSVKSTITHLCPIGSIVPSEADLYDYEPIRAIIEDTSFKSKVNLHSFSEVISSPELSDFIDDWQKEKLSDLNIIVRASSAAGSRPIPENLNLATVFFSCNSCRAILSLAAVFSHHHLIEKHSYTHTAGEIRLSHGTCAVKWNHGGKHVSFSYPAYQLAETIVSSCGLDPKLTTAEDMDKLDPFLECVSFKGNVSIMCVMGWRQAVIHAVDTADVQPAEWRFLDKETQAQARGRTAAMCESQFSRCRSHLCARCGIQDIKPVLRHHLMEVHHVMATEKDILPSVDHSPAPVYLEIQN